MISVEKHKKILKNRILKSKEKSKIVRNELLYLAKIIELKK